MASAARGRGHRSRSPRRRAEAEAEDAPAPAGRVAFATLATAAYQEGAQVLTAALRQRLGKDVDVLVFSPDELSLPAGVQLRPLAALPQIAAPKGAGAPVLPQFSFCWAKLGLWALEEYSAVVYMDSDMLPVGDVEPLLRDLPALGSLAAVPACQCWCEEECFYTSGPPAGQAFYFNAGLLVLRPCLRELEAMRRALEAAEREYPFAEQDFLNDHFRGKVLPLPPAYNALKYAFNHPRHREHLKLEACAVVHFVMVKPWERAARHEEEDFGELYGRWRAARAACAVLSFQRPRWAEHLVHPELPGLWCVPDFLPPEAEEALLGCLYGAELGAAWQDLSRRRVLCLGGVPHPEGALCDALPGRLSEAASWLREAGALSGPANQCFVNSYRSGQGIDAHMDGPSFHPEVAILSLEGPAVLRFGLVDKKERPDLPRAVEVLLRPRSLLVFRGEAYELYVHSIAHADADAVGEETVPRAPRRTSLTWRRLANVRLGADDVVTEEQRRARQAQFDWFHTELGEID